MSRPRGSKNAADANGIGRLVDTVKRHVGIGFDLPLAKKLCLSDNTIMKMRSRGVVGACFLVAASELTGMSVRQMKEIAGIPCLDEVKPRSERK
jgi:hypothetical protein